MTATGTKHDAGKPRASLLPWRELWSVVAVMEFGAVKYGEDNWKTVPNGPRRYFDAAIRHIMAWRDGELDDPESGLPHLSHAICCLLFAAWFDNKPNKIPETT